MKKVISSFAAGVFLCAPAMVSAQLGDIQDTLQPIAEAITPATQATAGALEGITPTGHFESFNAYWGTPPTVDGIRGMALHYDTGNRSVDSDKNYVSISYFPESRLKINQLSALSFELKPMALDACPAGSVRAEILINDNAPDGTRILATLKPGLGCKAGVWNKVNLRDAPWADWSSNSGQSFANKGDAHRWVKDQLGSDYKIWAIRIQFLGDKGFASNAWIDNVSINASSLSEPAQDFGFYLHFGEDDLAALGTSSTPVSGVGTGWFQATKNVRWSLPDQFSPVGGEALQYAPRSRTGDYTADAMSISYYVQDHLQINQLSNLSTYYYPRNGKCSEIGSPYFWLVMKSSDGTDTRDAFVRWTGDCGKANWRQLHFTGQKSSWSPGHIAFNQTVAPTRKDFHQAAVEELGADYRIETIRLVQENSSAETWVDGMRINSMTLNERAQDWSPASQVPAALVQADGFVALIEFPDEQMSINGNGAVIVNPDNAGRIKVRVTPYRDGNRDFASNAPVDQDHSYVVGGMDANDLILAFYDVSGQNSLTFQSNPEMRPPVPSGDGQSYDFVVDIPAGFSGGAYTVVVSDIGEHDISYDNRGSYYFLGKELLLSQGGSDAAHLADLMDTPEQFLHIDDSNVHTSPDQLMGCEPAASGHIADQQDDMLCYNYYNSARRGYEGPRSPIVIPPQ